MAKIQSNQIDQAFVEGMGAGFDIAIKSLYEIDEDEKSTNPASTIQAYTWATYLERVKGWALGAFVARNESTLKSKKNSPVE